MYHALDLGLSVADFWEMSPRGIFLLQEELVKSIHGKHSPADQQQGQRLNYIPR